MTAHPNTRQTDEIVATWLIRDLVERYPQVMPILASYGFDLCCGGGHTVREAAQLHGLDAEPIIEQVNTAIEDGQG